MTGIRSSLAPHVASGPTSPEDVRRKCAAAYHKDGVILLKPEWFETWADRKQLEILADKAFGKRQGKTT